MESNQTHKHAIALIGMMACGKSTVGKMLAKRLQWRFVDADAWIVEKAGMSVAEIFKREGEASFRRRETEALDALTRLSGVVIATGGGAPMFGANLPLLARVTVVQLKIDAEEVIRRTAHDTTRPMLYGENPAERVRTILEERQPAYDSASDVKIDTSGRSKEDVLRAVLNNRLVRDTVDAAAKELEHAD